jgi:hypothetical protein
MLDLQDAPPKWIPQPAYDSNIFPISSTLFSPYVSPFLILPPMNLPMELAQSSSAQSISPQMEYIFFGDRELPFDSRFESFPRTLDTSLLLLPQMQTVERSQQLYAAEDIDFDVCFEDKPNWRQLQDPLSIMLRSWKSSNGLFNVRIFI